MKRTMAAICLLTTVLVFLTALVMAEGFNIHVGDLITIPSSGTRWDKPTEGGNIHIGDMKIIPGLTTRAVYDDNIYLGNGSHGPVESKESDWIAHVKPSLFLDYSLGMRGYFKLGYRANLAYYGDNDKNNWQTQKGLFDLDYRAPGGLIVRVRNVYTDAEDPYSTLNQYELGRKIKRWHNNLKTKIGFDFNNRFKVLAYYNYYKKDYDDREDDTQNYDFNEFGAGYQMKLLPKTWGFVRYHHGKRDYSSHREGVNEGNDSDFEWNRLNAGLTWEPDSKLSGELNFGYQWKDYDNPINRDGYIYDDRNTWIASTFFSYKPALTRMLSLSILRALREVGAATDEYYTDTGIGMSLQQMLLHKATLSAGIVYSQNNYNVFRDRRRKDDNYKANIGLDYRIQDWLSAGIAYTYWRKDSNNTEFDFTDNRFMATLDVVY